MGSLFREVRGLISQNFADFRFRVKGADIYVICPFLSIS
jgi:hypothetical protein